MEVWLLIFLTWKFEYLSNLPQSGNTLLGEIQNTHNFKQAF